MKRKWYNKKMVGICVAGAAMMMLTACERQQFTVEGTIEGARDSMLYFENMALTGLQRLDSVKLGDDGRFAFHGERPEAPEFYVLRIADQIINVSIDSTETVTVKAQWPDMSARYEVSGSDNCEQIRLLALKQQELTRRAITLERTQGMTPQERADSLSSLLRSYKDEVTKQFIYREPNKAYAYFALFQTLGQWLIFNPHDSRDDMRAFAAVATSWDTFYPGSVRGENLHNIALTSMNDSREAMMRSSQTLDGTKIVQSGVIDLQLTDKNGQVRTLTELKGKVVLLDFHVFVMKESVQRILMLRELYNKYHDRGLEIYQVSVDQDEHFWKQMTAQLPWICVRDASGESTARYNVTEIPEFFTIDRNNMLQKRSSQMSDLDEEIKALL